MSEQTTLDLSKKNEIKDEKYKGQKGFEKISFSSTLKSIGKNSFNNTLVTSIEIPDTVTLLDEGCFSWCYVLTEIHLSSSITALNNHSFEGSSIQSVIIPEGVTLIGDNCFNDCLSLKKVQLPSTLQHIGNEAFRSTGICTLYLPEGVTFIGKRSYAMCENLKSITLPTTLKEIESGAFDGTKIKEVKLNKEIEEYDAMIPLFIKNKLEEEGIQCNHCYIDVQDVKMKLISDYKIPEGVEKIGDWCFACCSIPSIELPEGITSIGEGAFYQVLRLKEITIPSSVKTLGNSCFYGCKLLNSVEFPSELESIGEDCFRNCAKLANEDIELKSLKSLGEGSFLNTNISHVIIPSIVQGDDSLYFPEECEVETE